MVPDSSPTAVASVQAHGPATELVDDRAQDAVVHVVQAMRRPRSASGGHAGRPQVDRAIAPDAGEIADAAQEGIGDARGTTAPAGDLRGASPMMGTFNRPALRSDDPPGVSLP